MVETLVAIIIEFWTVLGEMAPYLIFGFVVAGLLSVLVSPEAVERHLSGNGIWPITKAALFGIPLPLCSCGVIPVAASLRRHGASRGATTSFLLSTPQTGVDSILVTLSLLGPVFAILRPLAALVTGLLGGTLVSVLCRNKKGAADGAPGCTEVCCTGEEEGSWIVRALKYGLVTLPNDIGRPMLVGLVIAGVLAALVPHDYFGAVLGKGIGAMLIMMIVGIPVYVCATASVPIAAVLIAKGISPGAALAFLMTGPATNAAAITTTWRVLGRRATILYLVAVAASALVCGLLLDYIVAPVAPSVAAHMPMSGILPEFLKTASAGAILVLLAIPLFRKQKPQPAEPETGEENRVVLIVEGMTCGRCVDRVRRVLLACPLVSSATVSLSTGEVIITGSDFDVEILRRAIEDLGYGVKASS